MEKIISRIRNNNLVPWIMVFYAVGIAGMLWPVSREMFQKLVPFTILMSFSLVLIFHGPLNKGFYWKAAVIFLGGILVEVAGVNTGLIFGDYSYGASLGPKIFHTPFIIGINWFMLVYCSLVIAGRLTDDGYFRVIIASVLMVVYDFALEPAAIRFDMWDWGGPVPLQNYIAWLVIAFIMNLFADRVKLINTENKIASPLFFIQLGFFVILDAGVLILEVWG